ncbi:Acetyltransferase (GNAT) family protein [Arboricoccus pini]|uniref:Acetyltransferase (GNAT) family protein n=1 Tax=Arboricoccus pini TaxID=1963835 RepID=A0A212QYW2_9PROT|nr:GNAT family N-acetyltransferase [Arboricoccus pini]SNB64909.1 Acetyltransferase (GNAT) family protein [Arboricoccus pini]
MAAKFSSSPPVRSSVAILPAAMAIRLLGPADEEAYEAHLRRLSTHDRSLRFCGGDIPATSPLRRDTACLLIGAFVEETLRAVAELHLIPAASRPTGEAAFSVEGGLQGRGIGRMLFTRTLERARDLRLSRVVLICEARNAPMIHLAQEFGARTSYEDGEVTGTIELPAQPASENILRNVVMSIAHPRLALAV